MIIELRIVTDSENSYPNEIIRFQGQDMRIEIDVPGPIHARRQFAVDAEELLRAVTALVDYS